MLDERTLLFMLAVIPALMALVAMGVRMGQPGMVDGLGSWAASLACFAAGSLVVATWPAAMLDTRIVLSNAGFAPAICLFGYSLLKFLGRRTAVWPWVVATLVLFFGALVLSQAPWQTPWRIALFSLYWLAMASIAVAALVRSGELNGGIGGIVLLLALVVLVLATLARLLLALGGSPQVTLLSGNISGFMTYFLAVIVVCLVIATLGLVLIAGERMRCRLEHLAKHDALTGLLTRNGFAILSTAALAKARREGGSVGFLIADIDHFKAINDGFGHQAGDAVLAAVASLLRGESRAVDLVSRFGGEEFALLLPGADLERALQIAERLRQKLSESPITAGQRNLQATISIGAASLPGAEADVERLYREADAALYRAKRLGRNRVEGGALTPVAVPA